MGVLGELLDLGLQISREEQIETVFRLAVGGVGLMSSHGQVLLVKHVYVLHMIDRTDRQRQVGCYAGFIQRQGMCPGTRC